MGKVLSRQFGVSKREQSGHCGLSAVSLVPRSCYRVARWAGAGSP